MAKGSSKKMRAVKSKDSKIEVKLRKALWHRGYRYRKHYKKAPAGTPDIAFPGLKIAVFCDSEFWHGKNWEERKHDFKSNQAYWLKKIEYNMDLDRRVNAALEAEGWLVLRFWGKDILRKTDEAVEQIAAAVDERKK